MKGAAPDPATASPPAVFRRAGYHDFRAYTELLASGRHQGFVLARHHTLCGIHQAVFRAGRPAEQPGDALEQAITKIDALVTLLEGGRLSLNGRYDGRSVDTHVSEPSSSDTRAIA